MREIPLHGKYGIGKVALVDDCDFEYLSNFKWIVSADGYVIRSVGTKGIRMHREILGVTDLGIIVDHSDRNKLNNTRKNLRIATKSENTANQKAISGSSKYKCVIYNKRCKAWSVTIYFNKKRYYMGLYKDEEEAACAANIGMIKYHGAFANLNDVDMSIVPKRLNKNGKKYRYICKYKNRDNDAWFAQVKVKGKNNLLGTFYSEEDAARAANLFIIENNLDMILNDVDISVPIIKKQVSSRFIGVVYIESKAKWRASINIGRNNIFLQDSKLEIEAAKARDYIVKNLGLKQKLNDIDIQNYTPSEKLQEKLERCKSLLNIIRNNGNKTILRKIQKEKTASPFIGVRKLKSGSYRSVLSILNRNIVILTCKDELATALAREFIIIKLGLENFKNNLI